MWTEHDPLPAGSGPFCEHLSKDEAVGGVLIILGLLAVTLSKHLEEKQEKALSDGPMGARLMDEDQGQGSFVSTWKDPGSIQS